MPAAAAEDAAPGGERSSTGLGTSTSLLMLLILLRLKLSAAKLSALRKLPQLSRLSSSSGVQDRMEGSVSVTAVALPEGDRSAAASSRACCRAASMPSFPEPLLVLLLSILLSILLSGLDDDEDAAAFLCALTLTAPEEEEDGGEGWDGVDREELLLLLLLLLLFLSPLLGVAPPVLEVPSTAAVAAAVPAALVGGRDAAVTTVFPCCLPVLYSCFEGTLFTGPAARLAGFKAAVALSGEAEAAAYPVRLAGLDAAAAAGIAAAAAWPGLPFKDGLAAADPGALPTALLALPAPCLPPIFERLAAFSSPVFLPTTVAAKERAGAELREAADAAAAGAGKAKVGREAGAAEEATEPTADWLACFCRALLPWAATPFIKSALLPVF